VVCCFLIGVPVARGLGLGSAVVDDSVRNRLAVRVDVLSAMVKRKKKKKKTYRYDNTGHN
jgi:hypothetical protein